MCGGTSGKVTVMSLTLLIIHHRNQPEPVGRGAKSWRVNDSLSKKTFFLVNVHRNRQLYNSRIPTELRM